MKYLPISINSITTNSLELRGIRNIQDAVRFMPGVRFQTSYSAFQQLSARGFDHSIMMIDGIRDERSAVNNSYPVLDLSCIESIELLKGPVSVLYGHSAVGGTLNIVRRSPSEKQSANARLVYSSYENKEATLGMGGKSVGPVGYYANVNFSDQKGQRDNGNRRLSGYLALQAKITERDVLNVHGGFNRNFYGTEIGLPDLMANDVYNVRIGQLYLHENGMSPGLNHEARHSNESDFMKNHVWNTSTQYTHTSWNDAKLTDRLSYNNDDISYSGMEVLDYLESDDPAYDHYYMENGQKKYICLDSVYLSFPLRFSHIAKTVANMLELSDKLRTGKIKHTYMGGYSFVALNRTSYSGYNLGDDVRDSGLYSHVSTCGPHSMGYMISKFSKATATHHYSNSLYLQDVVELDEQQKVLTALRYDLFRYMSTSVATPTGRCEYEEHPSFNIIKNKALIYRFGAAYLPHPNTSIYASSASFFKPIRMFYQDNVIHIGGDGNRFKPARNGEVFKPRKGYQAEVELKYQLNNILGASVNLFYIQKMNSTTTLTNNCQVEVNGETITMSVIGQVGIQDSKGFDLDVIPSPVNILALTIGYGLDDSKIREIKEIKDPELIEAIYDDNSGETKQQLNSQEGSWQNSVPDQTFYAYGSYTIPQGVLKNLEFHLSSSYTGKVYRNTSSNSWFDPYWVTDFGTFYLSNNNIHLTFNLNNLFDNNYYNRAFGRQMVPNMPRSFQVAISYTL